MNTQVNEVGIQVCVQEWEKAKYMGVGAAAKLYRRVEHTQNPAQTHNNTYHEQENKRQQENNAKRDRTGKTAIANQTSKMQGNKQTVKSIK